MDMRCIALLACGLALLAPRTLAQTCPPPGFDSAANLDFAKCGGSSEGGTGGGLLTHKQLALSARNQPRAVRCG